MSQILPSARPAVTPERVLATLTADQRTAALTGFSDSERHGLPPSPECAIIGRR